jgi:hypothetical protein
MSGFRRKRRTIKIIFQGDLDGLEITAYSVSMDTFLEFEELSNRYFGGKTGKDEKASMAIQSFRRMLDMFAGVLVSWNLEDEDGEPVPATREELGREDPGFVFDVIVKWMEAVAGVSAPLSETSSSGETSAELSLPMDIQ